MFHFFLLWLSQVLVGCKIAASSALLGSICFDSFLVRLIFPCGLPVSVHSLLPNLRAFSFSWLEALVQSPDLLSAPDLNSVYTTLVFACAEFVPAPQFGLMLFDSLLVAPPRFILVLLDCSSMSCIRSSMDPSSCWFSPSVSVAIQVSVAAQAYRVCRFQFHRVLCWHQLASCCFSYRDDFTAEI
jgi:hypothetical protein